MTAGRHSKYSTAIIQKVDEFIKLRTDRTVKILVKKNPRGGKEYAEKLIVKLPTIEGFADYIGITRKTLYNWEKDHSDFKNALERIKTIQMQRLIDMGLSGQYNSTIAKLILSSNHGMREKSDLTTDNEPINLFSNDQIAKIAEEVLRRKGNGV